MELFANLSISYWLISWDQAKLYLLASRILKKVLELLFVIIDHWNVENAVVFTAPIVSLPGSVTLGCIIDFSLYFSFTMRIREDLLSSICSFNYQKH